MFKQFSWILFLISFIGCNQSSETFNQIGVVEGFYGNPWGHEARLDLVRFMGEVDMNVYYYAPKDDPFHRSRWREPYEGEKLDEFRELLEVSNASGVDLYFAISPGLDIVYSDSSDFKALVNKLENMTKLGVEHIALFLDDVPQKLQHEQDQENYETLADAHIDLINKLWEKLLANDIQLVVCPTTYTSAWGSREYIQKLGAEIPKDIPLFWTGEDVAIAEITTEATRQWGKLMNREPLIWDNFPVNDFEGWRPILGPLTGRDAELPNLAEGIVANPMDLPYASMIPLYTVADYANNSQNYDPDESLKNAVRFLAGDEAFDPMYSIVKIYGDYGWTDNLFTPIYTPGKPLDDEKLFSALDSLQYHFNELKKPFFKENEYVQHFVRELEPFVEETRIDLQNLVQNDYSPDTFELPYTNNWGENKISFKAEDDRLVAELSLDEAQQNTEWILILTGYENPPETWLQPEDLIVRWKIEHSDSARADHFDLTSFTQRGISDIKVRTITSFFEHFTTSSDLNVSSAKIEEGDKLLYQISVPLPAAQKIRFNSFLNPGGYMLSKQAYLGNPHTYPILNLQR